jgi:ApbE superfamily uncharacterized protein (UPF0280 family)
MNSDDAGQYNVRRSYRARHEAKDLHYFQVSLKETDLFIGVDKSSYSDSLPEWCARQVRRLRGDLETYIDIHPDFRSAFVPLALSPGAPALALTMAQAAWQTGVGPMAAVAGAIAQALGEKLRHQVNEVVVENGGDIYLSSSVDRMVSVLAGHSKFSGKIAVRVEAGESPLGICTSSGTVGPSVSMGKADAVLVKGSNAALADAAATGAANLIQTEHDLMAAIDYVKSIPGLSGILAIKGDRLAAWGKIEIVPIKGGSDDENRR